MLLIVLGHIRGISFPFQMFLYSFHVQCFFIIPFLYPSKSLSRNNVTNLFLKLFWPFVLLYVLQVLISIYVFHDSYFSKAEELITGIPNVELGIWSFITGGIELINKFCGTQFLWFLPCFLSMSLIRMWYAGTRPSKFITALILIIGAVCFIIYSVVAYNPFLPEDFFIISEAISPFSIWQGFGYFALGFAALYIIKECKIKKEYFYWGIVLAVSALYVVFNVEQIFLRIARLTFPIIFFLAFYHSRERLERLKFLHKIGTHSLAIYLIHPFLCIISAFIIPQTIISNPVVIICQFLVILSVSYLIAVVIERVSVLRMILFPRGEEIGLLPRG